MNDIAACVGSPIIATINGKDWTLSPLNLRSIGRLARWRRQQAAKELLDMGILSDKERWDIIKGMLDAVDLSESMTFDVDSICYMLWLAAVPNNPGLEFETFADQIRMDDMEQLNTLAGSLLTGGDVTSLEPEEANADDPPTVDAGKE